MPQASYQELREFAKATALLASVESLLGWDERCLLPPQGAEYRARQTKLLAGMLHERQTDPRLGELLAELSAGPLTAEATSDAAVVVRELQRQYDKKTRLPKKLVEELAHTAVMGQQAWQIAKARNDYPSFEPWLAKMVDLKRQQADLQGWTACRYDALLDDFEPKETTSNLRGVLGELRNELVPLVRSIASSGRKPQVEVLHRHYPLAEQDRFSREVAARIGFDFERGRLDVSAHPFCSGVGPNDCRLTTRYDEHFFNSAFFGTLHEAGHGIYEQGLPNDEYGLPTGEAVSLGIHESQSRLWENFVGRSRAFWEHLYPQAQSAFPSALADVPLDTFHAAINDVRPSLIRVEADEATYNLHILIRFELEQAIVNGDAQPADLPGAWREKYAAYLGITPGTDALGVLQDIHWSAGLFGYFPTYSLGNLYAAQFFAQADQDLGGVSALIRKGEFAPLRHWLTKNIHARGKRLAARELVKTVTGEPLTPRHLVEYLKSKYGPIYGL